MEDRDKKADEIVEETMKEIFEDLNNSEAFQETEDKNEEIYMDSDDIPSDDDSSTTEELEEDDDFEDSDEEEDDDQADMEEKAARKKKHKKTAAIIIGSIFCVLLLIYVGFAIFFNNHFMFYTKINGIDFSLKNVSQVEAYMEQQVKDYVLTLEESDGDREEINGSDISLEYVPGDELKKLVKEQDNFLWITSLWNHPEIEAEVGVKYDADALSAIISNLECMKEENQTVSVDAHPEFQNDQFVVVPEVVGTQINIEVFSEKVEEAINGFQPTLDLYETGCYILPRFLSDSEEVIAAKDAMNSYLGANITYDFNPYTEVVDASVISQWVSVDADMNVTFDEGAVRAYVQSLANKYDTKGKPRNFTTATGNVVTVEGGSYGWKIDQEAEYNALIANIQNGETVTREPNYVSRAASHEGNDVGSTYAEVDLTAQQMYFIQDGQVVLQSGVVTGNPNRGNGTPQGVYTLAYKALDQTLRGTKKPDGTYEYETPVKYWMPFNGGIGFHDATWQSSFGGSRYLTNGSHGCVNLPYDVAGQLYNLISAGTPVVCHY
ncbi:L,D-transpeptidase family protein [Faecalicatena contorta]|uniref:L,D-transpeptidase family protein n=1 Tax=Lachnospiraceae TaxID=186803 RepID=UPI001F27A4B8|nr:peptidoglycan binding domain-containing protein [Faecalicatena contorta]MCF2667358.1 L,D-transpeptidase/peptidoglycan binding protein [Faecalicatena contorta]